MYEMKKILTLLLVVFAALSVKAQQFDTAAWSQDTLGAYGYRNSFVASNPTYFSQFTGLTVNALINNLGTADLTIEDYDPRYATFSCSGVLYAYAFNNINRGVDSSFTEQFLVFCVHNNQVTFLDVYEL